MNNCVYKDCPAKAKINGLCPGHYAIQKQIDRKNGFLPEDMATGHASRQRGRGKNKENGMTRTQCSRCGLREGKGKRTLCASCYGTVHRSEKQGKPMPPCRAKKKDPAAPPQKKKRLDSRRSLPRAGRGGNDKTKKAKDTPDCSGDGAQAAIARACDSIKEMLLEKNRKYGNSALEPARIFSKADSIEQLNVRIDDKLSRIASAQGDDDEDSEQDLIGYLILRRIAKRET